MKMLVLVSTVALFSSLASAQNIPLKTLLCGVVRLDDSTVVLHRQLQNGTVNDFKIDLRNSTTSDVVAYVQLGHGKKVCVIAEVTDPNQNRIAISQVAEDK